jgi:hypothetical protein
MGSPLRQERCHAKDEVVLSSERNLGMESTTMEHPRPPSQYEFELDDTLPAYLKHHACLAHTIRTISFASPMTVWTSQDLPRMTGLCYAKTLLFYLLLVLATYSAKLYSTHSFIP